MVKKITLENLLAADDNDSLISELTFEDGIRVLEELVTKVESGSLALDKAIISYEKGVRLIEKLRGLLSGAEEKLKILQKTGNGSNSSKTR